MLQDTVYRLSIIILILTVYFSQLGKLNRIVLLHEVNAVFNFIAETFKMQEVYWEYNESLSASYFLYSCIHVLNVFTTGGWEATLLYHLFAETELSDPEKIVTTV